MITNFETVLRVCKSDDCGEVRYGDNRGHMPEHKSPNGEDCEGSGQPGKELIVRTKVLDRKIRIE